MTCWGKSIGSWPKQFGASEWSEMTTSFVHLSTPVNGMQQIWQKERYVSAIHVNQLAYPYRKKRENFIVSNF